MNRSLLLLALSAGALGAAEPQLSWLPSGLMSKLSYYRPTKLVLSDTKPESLRKAPADLKAPHYATLTAGPKESPTSILVVLDEPAGAPSRVWVDANANGDLTDDPAVEWTPRERDGKTSYSGRFEAQIAYGSETRALGFKCYRFDPTEKFKTNIFYYRDYGWAGEVAFGSRKVKALLVDETASGDFRGVESTGPAPVALLLDLNGDNRFDFRSEQFDVRKPFAVDNAAYEITGLTANGAGFQIVSSTKPAAEIIAAQKKSAPIPASTVTTGGKALEFEATTMDGKKVRFPGDYKGRLVMLDFWATWCGPCRAEVPNLVKVHADLRAKGFDVLGITLDDANAKDVIEKYTASEKMDWPQIFDGEGWRGDLVKLYGVRGIPACFLVDGTTGQVVAAKSELRGDALRATVERCLAAIGQTAPEPKTDTSSSRSTPQTPDPAVAKAAALQKAGKLIDLANWKAQLQSPRPERIGLARPATQPLAPREIARRARAAYVRAGWYYRCTKCDRTHTKLAGGYAIATDLIVTARHVLAPPDAISEGSPIVVNEAGDVFPITTALAADEAGDAIIVRVGTDRLHPLAFATSVEQGDAAYCYSDPLSQRGYFSAGIVNRLLTLSGEVEADPMRRRMNVSTDWAPGSSGAAVLDAQANVIGHVSRINPLSKRSGKTDGHDEPTLITLHEAIPTSVVQALVEKANAAAGRR